MCCWMVCFENLIESQKSVKDPLETRLWKPKSPRAGSSSAVVSMSAINCLLKVKQRLSTRYKELYCPLIKHSVHAAVMWSFFWQTWRLFKVFCRTILAMVRNFPWIIHLTAGDAAVKNSSLGRKEIKMGLPKNNNKKTPNVECGLRELDIRTPGNKMRLQPYCCTLFWLQEDSTILQIIILHVR